MFRWNKLYTMSPAALAGATVEINLSGVKVWTGTTDVNGYAKDINGLSPSLKYGDYSVTASKYGYVSDTKTFNIPTITTLTMLVTAIYQTIEIIVSD